MTQTPKRSILQAIVSAVKQLLALFKKLATALCAIFFMLAGSFHFLKPDVYEQIMPEILPFPIFLIYLSGLCEILGGLGLLIPRFRKRASWGLIALLIAVFPANINMAVNSVDFGMPHELLWWRLPIQLLFIIWVWYCGKD